MVNLKYFCDQLSKDLGVENDPIREESPGVFNLPIEENTAVKIEAVSDGFSMYCVLADCPKESQDIFFTEVMNANLFGLATANNVLGITDDGNRLTLSRVIDYNIDYKGFSEFLQDFCNIALVWREQAIQQIKTK